MKKDLDLFEAVRTGFLTGALRIYNWAEPTVTIGYHQKSFIPADPSLKVPVLQRPTGGGAVLHTDDITFSMSFSPGGLLSTNIPECSARISDIFAGAFRRCGLDAQARGGKHGFSEICFARPSPVELLLSGYKLMGIALARKERFLLVQGVIPLTVDVSLSKRVFGDRLKRHPMGILDHKPDFSLDLFVDGLRENFLSELGILLSDGDKKNDQCHDAYERKIESR
jgi:lipoate-protein ligase A